MNFSFVIARTSKRYHAAGLEIPNKPCPPPVATSRPGPPGKDELETMASSAFPALALVTREQREKARATPPPPPPATSPSRPAADELETMSSAAFPALALVTPGQRDRAKAAPPPPT